jgi:pimeloyl-ACP methyl ester carboxylesterase
MRSRNQPAVPISFDVQGSGAPLILLHGLSGSRQWWVRNVPAMANDHRTYCVDLPGFGDSRALRWRSMDSAAERLVAWMADQDLERATIAGHSMGGAIAALVAATRPEKVDLLILANASIRPPGAPFAPRAADVPRSLLTHANDLTALAARDFLRCDPASLLLATTDVIRTDWSSLLGRITAPTLVIWGEHDVITPITLGHAIAVSIPDARLAIVPDAGHNPMWEQADAFNAEVLRFLRHSDQGK